MRKDKSFTLIELLVVIAVIGMLSSIVLVSLRPARAKARDTKRLADLRQIVTALQLYYDKYGRYPDNTDTGDVGCWSSWDGGSILNGENDPFIQPLVNEGLIKTPIERRPVGSSGWEQCSYRYMRVQNPCCGCQGWYAVLYAVCETNNCPTGERPICCTCWGEGAGAWDPRDIAIFLPE